MRKGPVAHAKDVVAGARLDGEGGEGSDEEEGAHHGEMLANHEAGEVLAVALPEEVAGLLTEEGRPALGGGELGHGKEGDLHSLEHAHDGHEEEEEEDGERRLDGRVLDGHGGVAVEEGLEG